MGPGKDLSESEKSVIISLGKEDLGPRVIAKRVKRSASAVQVVLIRGTMKSVLQWKGAPRKLCPLKIRLIARHARSGKYRAQELRNLYAPNVTVRGVQLILAATPDLRWSCIPRASMISESQKRARLLWARKHLALGSSFLRRTVFSDEKCWA